jgi:hypothetical protein
MPEIYTANRCYIGRVLPDCVIGCVHWRTVANNDNDTINEFDKLITITLSDLQKFNILNYISTTGTLVNTLKENPRNSR